LFSNKRKDDADYHAGTISHANAFSAVKKTRGEISDEDTESSWGEYLGLIQTEASGGSSSSPLSVKQTLLNMANAVGGPMRGDRNQNLIDSHLTSHTPSGPLVPGGHMARADDTMPGDDHRGTLDPFLSSSLLDGDDSIPGSEDDAHMHDVHDVPGGHIARSDHDDAMPGDGAPGTMDAVAVGMKEENRSSDWHSPGSLGAKRQSIVQETEGTMRHHHHSNIATRNSARKLSSSSLLDDDGSIPDSEDDDHMPDVVDDEHAFGSMNHHNVDKNAEIMDEAAQDDQGAAVMEETIEDMSIMNEHITEQ